MFDSLMQEEEQKTLTVSELSDTLKSYLKNFSVDGFWVKGEILSLKVDDKRKYVSFLLCEKKDNSNDIVAQIQVVCWPDNFSKIVSKLKSVDDNLDLKDGLFCRLKCVVDIWVKAGRIQLVVKDIDPAATIGELHFLRMKIFNEIVKMGIHEKNKLLVIPICPLKIALISSKDGAGYHDFISGIKNSGFPFVVDFYNCSVQGPDTEKDVVSALSEISKKSKMYDVAVIIRGGGSTADLKWFDNKNICISICNAKIPVLTGIGHEINISAADMVANKSFKTPTAVAVFLENKVFEFSQEVSDMAKSIHYLAKNLLLQEKTELSSIIKDIASFFHTDMQQKKTEIKSIITSLKPLAFRILKDSKIQIESFLEKTNIYSPKNTLKLGYTLTRDKNGKILNRVKDLVVGEKIISEFFDGKAESVINNKEVY